MFKCVVLVFNLLFVHISRLLFNLAYPLQVPRVVSSPRFGYFTSHVMRASAHLIALTVAPLVPILLSILIMPVCVKPCSRDFRSQASLSKHQFKCAAHKTSMAIKIERRRLMSSRDHDNAKWEDAQKSSMQVDGVSHTWYHSSRGTLNYHYLGASQFY